MDLLRTTSVRNDGEDRQSGIYEALELDSLNNQEGQGRQRQLTPLKRKSASSENPPENCARSATVVCTQFNLRPSLLGNWQAQPFLRDRPLGDCPVQNGWRQPGLRTPIRRSTSRAEEVSLVLPESVDAAHAHRRPPGVGSGVPCTCSLWASTGRELLCPILPFAPTQVLP